MKKQRIDYSHIRDLVSEVLNEHLVSLQSTVNWKRVVQIQEPYPPDSLFKRSIEHYMEHHIITGGQPLKGFDFTNELKLSFLSPRDGRQLPYHRKKHRFSLLSHNALRVCGKRVPCNIEIDSHFNVKIHSYTLPDISVPNAPYNTALYRQIRKVFDELWEQEEPINEIQNTSPLKAFENWVSVLRTHFNKDG